VTAASNFQRHGVVRQTETPPGEQKRTKFELPSFSIFKFGILSPSPTHFRPSGINVRIDLQFYPQRLQRRMRINIIMTQSINQYDAIDVDLSLCSRISIISNFEIMK
jgi:hypothetical protein